MLLTIAAVYNENKEKEKLLLLIIAAVVSDKVSLDNFSVTATGHWPPFCCK